MANIRLNGTDFYNIDTITLPTVEGGIVEFQLKETPIVEYSLQYGRYISKTYPEVYYDIDPKEGTATDWKGNVFNITYTGTINEFMFNDNLYTLTSDYDFVDKDDSYIMSV